ncbi:MAG: DUF4124 domain-containing protein [Cocleimonas sp.]
MKTMSIKKVSSVFPITAITLMMLLVSTSSHAEIYKWTDAKGVTHYSSQKPTQRKIKSENIEDKIRSAAGKYQASSNVETKKNKGDDLAKENGNNKDLAGPDAKLVSFCNSHRKNLAALRKNFRNTWKDKDGKQTRLSQKERQDKVLEIQNQISKECAGV